MCLPPAATLTSAWRHRLAAVTLVPSRSATDAARVNLSSASSSLTSTETPSPGVSGSIAPTQATVSETATPFSFLSPDFPTFLRPLGNAPPTAHASYADDLVTPAFSPRSERTSDHVRPPSREVAACGDAFSSSPTRKCRRSTPSTKNSAGSRCVAGAPGARASTNGADQGVFVVVLASLFSPRAESELSSPIGSSSMASRLDAHTAGLEASLLDLGATHAQR
mmetsp:Transcript_45/g.174  ORF Transcript_45/g.174 Transcript_45/m.174 type:complete len:223 (+) Transcript_45:1093-1761(+)